MTAIGAELPVRTTTVKAARMKVFSLLTNDPNPIHWDPDAVTALGLGDRLINQGGLNVGYVITAVADWAGGPERIVDVKVRFLGNVFDGEEVRAGGTVRAVEDGIATIDVWLMRPDDTVAIRGTIRAIAPA